MLLMSRHLTEYNIVPANAVIRINLAWEPSLEDLRIHLAELTHHVFLDIPSGRKKPPSNNHNMSDIFDICRDHSSIKYLGISQVEDPEQLMPWIVKTSVNIVPKIESIKGIQNIEEVCKVLRKPSIIMLDHDDLFQNLCDNRSLSVEPSRMYEDWINPLLEKCKNIGVRVLKTAGIVFTEK